ncbi:MAG: hypothetical protein K8G79_01015 [bacterium]|uniref:Polymerase nucleotidyl transferase domain-containing protein n=1 Tax=Candidatus Methylomirabilis tolerans TaxID=3123416 RepID=A0AAJ1AHE4_9BACT|nr:hypothetical protein [Candidatus Methylomirabilis sp.]
MRQSKSRLPRNRKDRGGFPSAVVRDLQEAGLSGDRKRQGGPHRALEFSPKQAVAVLSGVEGVKRISLVRSFARNGADLFIDLDILVVMNTDRSFIDRPRMLSPLLSLPVDLDLLCYIPDELKQMEERPFRMVVEADLQ